MPVTPACGLGVAQGPMWEPCGGGLHVAVGAAACSCGCVQRTGRWLCEALWGPGRLVLRAAGCGVCACGCLRGCGLLCVTCVLLWVETAVVDVRACVGLRGGGLGVPMSLAVWLCARGLLPAGLLMFGCAARRGALNGVCRCVSLRDSAVSPCVTVTVCDTAWPSNHLRWVALMWLNF